MKYPEIGDVEFYDKIGKIYEKYKIPKKKKSLEEICFPKEFNLQLPQKFVSQFIHPKTPYKGVLVYHRIGAGKTCTAVRIAEEWKNYKKIMVLVPAALIGNFKNELRSLCADNNYLKPDERKKLASLHPADKEYREIIEKSDDRIEKYYNVMSYNKFVSMSQNKEISLKNTILIVDEVQNMVSEQGAFYQALYEEIYRAPSDLRTVLLSATPMFDRPSELGLTLNLLRPKKEFPCGRDFEKMFVSAKKLKSGKYDFKMKNSALFKEMIKGYVSYFRGAPPHVFPEMTIKYVRCEMSDFQYSVYKTIIRNEEKKSFARTKAEITKDVLEKELPNNFFIGTRVSSNIVFPNGKIGEEGVNSLRGKHVRENLEKYSTKMAKIIQKIGNTSGKVFIYSNFKDYGGISSFVRVLEELGYKNYAEHGEGRKCFGIFSGDENAKQKEEIKSVYNQKSNLNGSKMKIILLSPAATAGISLFGVRQAHILDPTWNWSKMMQIIGRGSRFCSHKDLPEEKRNIKVYIYQAVREEEKQTVDEYISFLAKQKDKLIMEFEQIVKEAAVDCTLNLNANDIFEGEEKIVCE